MPTVEVRGVARCTDMAQARTPIAASLLGVLALVAACGDDIEGPGPTDIEGKLAALDGVTVTAMPTANAGYKFFVLRFEQPVDHADPGGAKFEQRVSLLHKEEAAPMVALTSGYWDYYIDRPYELTSLISANQ